jgi:hypothetical protein
MAETDQQLSLFDALKRLHRYRANVLGLLAAQVRRQLDREALRQMTVIALPSA